MIIKGLFRRYERWNPVHPTSGAFWGMGIGVGCGVGWGPGFGPEVIGYVGAGCGVGFCVGFTFTGFGIGLPANWLYQVPYNGIVASISGVRELVRSNDLLSQKNAGRYGWDNIAPQISGIQKEATRRFSSFTQKHYLNKNEDLLDLKTALSVPAMFISDKLDTVQIIDSTELPAAFATYMGLQEGTKENGKKRREKN